MVKGVQVEVLNVLGAGDAFMSGLLRGWLRGEPWQTSAGYANACGALVVSRHGCAPAMPTETELFDYLERRDDVPRPDRDARLNDLHAKTTRHPADWGPIHGLAFDHRSQLFDMAAELGVDAARLSPLKTLLVTAAEQGKARAGVTGTPAVLCDDVIGQIGQHLFQLMFGQRRQRGLVPIRLPQRSGAARHRVERRARAGDRHHPRQNSQKRSELDQQKGQAPKIVAQD